jgi:catechol 2,3-dioxygenase-like lactoylglutathione lyase family enzyme
MFMAVATLITTYHGGSAAQPAHCIVRGSAAPRTGVDGKAYETRFELRLPTEWSGRFLYQGGGGNDGIVAPAVGRNTGSFPDTGLQRGFAVVTTDAGHQGGTPDFGLDPVARGASKLIFTVRDLDAVVARLAARRAPVVTIGGNALDTPSGRAMLVRDPDGYLVEVRQASAAAVTAATAAGDVIETAIWISVARREHALAFYDEVLGFQIRATRIANDAELRVNGLAEGRLTQTVMAIPGIGATVILAEFARPATANPAARPFEWRIQDVGAPQFQLEVAGLDALLESTARAGYRFLSVGGQPIQRPFGRFVFAIDPDGILVEYVEPAARAR